ncbi:unnamed protein product [Miscanthus lutarioriparius]|uniref:Uncharacterized protein n=1 Tax=Miscanthus lutarioriparius TaxID=422564 RepID=A0A811MV71_9POAL|nr:unnamed protein product [Miscanthus lutarioriparius]
MDATAGDTESQEPPKTLVDWALEILSTADPDEKARLGDLAASRWLRGDIPLPYDPSRLARPTPDRPARSAEVRLLPPPRMPKLGKGGSAQSRLAMLHSLAHTESWAVDLSSDIVARFGAGLQMSRGFFDDLARVAQDEGRHYTVLSARLGELGSHYGALPAHDGLWDSAMRTSHSLLARLAVEHCVHEARGLDVLPTTISRFRAGGDEQTARLLEDIVYPEEILVPRSDGNHPTSYPVPELEPRFFLLSGDGTADGKTAREAGGEPTPILAKDVSNDDKMVQQVEDKLPSRIAEDANGQVKAIEHVKDGPAKCKLDDSIDKDEEAVIRIFHGVARRRI